MKRYLLFVIAFVCVSIGAWAVLPPINGDGYKLDDGPTGIGKWFVPGLADAFPPEKVIIVEVSATGGVAGALNELNSILRGNAPKYNNFRNKLNEQMQVANSQNQNLTFNNFIANDKLILKLKYTGQQTLTLSDADIAALNAFNIPTIDLQDLKPASVFTLDNDHVKNLILPDGWTKAQVEAAASSCGNLHSALSIGTTTTDVRTSDGVTKDATIMAYVKKPGTLIESTRRLGYDGNLNTKVGQIGPNNFSMDKVAVAELAGHVSARDYSNGLINFDENGHFVFDKEADENSSVTNAAIGGGTRSLVGTAQYGALPAGLVVLDLGDAIIEEVYNKDLTLSMTGCLGKVTEKVVLPTYPGLKTIPADCLNTSTKVRDICIPGNIEYIKTRAFNGNADGGRLAYVWTTGTDTDVRYDNGACFTDGDENICHDEEGYVRNGCLYGTFTLPPNLKLIERFAFGSSINVKDVYVLNENAPECHVDAFSSDMYVGNNTYNASSIVDGIITRDAYIQGDASNHRFITMLHYPREAGTPNTQRFTDPSREYSVATGERDGNGNMIYFPNQSEFSYAYLQGSYGYVWKGWNDARNWFNNELQLGFGNEFALDKPAHSALAANGQTLANGLWTNNPSIRFDDGHLEKYDRTFYDLTLGENNQPDEVSAPATDPTELKPYYEVYRRDYQLYPQAKYETSNYVYVLDDNGDYVKDPSSTCPTVFRDYVGSADDQLERYSRKQVLVTDNEGNIIYNPCDGGAYVQEFDWVEDDVNGTHIHDFEYPGNPNGKYVQDYEWVVDNVNGTHYRTFVEVEKVNPYTGDNSGDWVNHYKYENGQYVTFEYDWQYNQYQGPVYALSDDYFVWTEGAEGYIEGVTDKYRRSFFDTYRLYDSALDAADVPRYDYVDNGYVLATEADADKQHYSKNYLGTYRHFASTDDVNEQRYCTDGVDYVSETPITYSVLNDYRGWHQFVLTAAAHNSTEEFEPLRSFITDNDWWTICAPYDLRYNDVVKFYGFDRQGFEKKIPYVSKLMYVIRDVEHQTITLMFSKNLMEYKEQRLAKDTQDGFATESRVHGYIDDETPWTPEEIEGNPVILHAGVPYMIRPNLTVDAETGNINATRQFDIYKNDFPELYERLKEAQEKGGTYQKDLIYNGMYTVPAYVVGTNPNVTENTTDSRTFEMKDGSKFTYTSTNKTIKYHGKDVPYSISEDFSYTFVGTFYKSVMPQYCYFLGWDSEKNQAAFWYSRVQDESGWNWNNETGVICPNFNTNLQIHGATSLKDPARWILATSANQQTNIKCDDFTVGAAASNAKQYTMDYGASMNLASVDEDPLAEDFGDQEVLSIDEIQSLDAKAEWYNVNGQKLNGRPTQSGVYIMGNKKYVVK